MDAAAATVAAAQKKTPTESKSGIAAAAVETNIERWATANDAFHRGVAALSGMKLLVELTGRALDQWTRLRRRYRPTLAARIPEAQREHHQMVALLAQANGDALAALVVEHNRSARQAYLNSTHTPSSEEPQ
jgi:DNA-binding GntR family transcriptional regulator